MRKVKIEFEFILDKDKFRFTKSMAQLRVFDGKKEFVIREYLSAVYFTRSK